MLKPLALAALSVSMVHAATAEPISPRDASKLLKDMGSTGVSIKWVNDETARIEATLKDYFFNVRLMNCNDEGLCASSMIFTTFSNTMTATHLDVHSCSIPPTRMNMWLVSIIALTSAPKMTLPKAMWTCSLSF